MTDSRAPHLARLIAEIRREAATGVEEGPPPMPGWSLHRLFKDTGHRQRYEQVSFARRRRLAGLAATGRSPSPTCSRARQVDELFVSRL